MTFENIVSLIILVPFAGLVVYSVYLILRGSR
jgi:hypothetical protein